MDWDSKRAFADRMIKKYGRAITLVKDGVASNPANPLGATTAPIKVGNVPAVFVSPGGDSSLGSLYSLPNGLFREAEQIAIVLPSLVNDFREFTRVEDYDGTVWKLFEYDELKPATVPIVAYLGLRR